MPQTDLDNAVATALIYGEDHALADTIAVDADRMLVRQRMPEGGEDWITVDLTDQYADAPRRARGTVSVHDGASFVTAITQRGEAVVYADEEKLALVGVLNDDFADAPGWRDHTVSLALRPTNEWAAWKAGSGQIGSQEVFARRIEDGLPEIVSPDGATMLELAQTFHASTETKFRSGIRLADGQTQFLHDEDIKASAGAKPGTITIPDTFTLGVAPFIGAVKYEVTARLRYSLKQGQLSIGYVLVRPEDVERDAFNAVLADVATAMKGTTFLRGPAPARAS